MGRPRRFALALVCATAAIGGWCAASLGGFEWSGIENPATPIWNRGAASALATVALPAAPRFQIGVAGVSIPDHAKPPRLAAHPATAAVAHTSASAKRRGLPIARLPPFGYPKAGRTAGTR